jgi:hypothetical protein
LYTREEGWHVLNLKCTLANQYSNSMWDTLKGLALVSAFVGVLTIFAMWVSLWENVWQAAVEPTRASIYAARLGPSHCLTGSWSWWWTEKCKVI